jgi:hypothetical protein
MMERKGLRKKPEEVKSAKAYVKKSKFPHGSQRVLRQRYYNQTAINHYKKVLLET